jgi:hypothetical protein
MKLLYLLSILFFASFNASAMDSELNEFEHLSGTYRIGPRDMSKGNGTVEIEFSGKRAIVRNFEFTHFSDFYSFEALKISESSLIEKYGQERYAYSIEFGEQQIANFMKTQLVGHSYTLDQVNEARTPQFCVRALDKSGEENLPNRDLRLIIDGSNLLFFIEYPYGLGQEISASALQRLPLTREGPQRETPQVNKKPNSLSDIEKLAASLRIQSPPEPMQVEEAPRFTYRTTGATLGAKNKHSAVAIQLSGEELQYPAYQLTVHHRTGENGSSVRIFIPGIDYSPLGGLPSSVGFEDKDFDLSPWVEAVRGDSSSPSAIKTFLSFVGGQSDVHSFKIRSGERTLKEVIFGNVDSESQPGIHVYAPETDGDANEWSGVKSDDVQQ